ncbi:glycosyltransferase family 2 protein [Arthrobacter sp. GMC3]|uniref:glycosyltransferase family 2 protein n=1 Tax=Arthrobacter sp. GMC3 TaxID=2058894 RepID=UPI000CE4FF0C|nr:glycosyltransferase family 2 protein [Arthrobacter sp. GMC3]
MNDFSRRGLKMFALIVVNYGSSRLLAKNLAGLELSELGGRIVIVDNFTTEKERGEVQRLASAENWMVVALDSNRGFGAAVNEGSHVAFEAGVEAIAVLNPDAHIDSSNLLHLVSAVLDDTDLMAAPVIRTSEGRIWFDGMELYGNSGRVASERRPVPPSGPHEPWISGACFAISRSLWEQVGGFDEDYFLYWEDVDLSRRVVESGGHLAVLKNVGAVHDAGGTQTRIGGVGTKSETYYFYNIRNRLIYAAKHLDGSQLRRWIYATPRVSYEILLGGGRRQLLYSVVPLRAYVRGIVDGHRMLLDIRKRSRLLAHPLIPR